jgi:hypothetical protein
VIKAAYLRVYLPVAEGADTGTSVRDRLDIPVAGRYGLISEPLDEGAIGVEWGGRRYRCPRTPRLRILEGVLAIRRAYRQLGEAEVVPEGVARAARRELEAIRSEDPTLRAHILTSAWHVPFRWFVPFDPATRELVGDGDGMSVRYRTLHHEGMDRLRRAIGILDRSGLGEGVAGEVVELMDWLAGFPPDALVELDYGSVSHLFDETDLVLDDSAADVWASLEALERGDRRAAMEHYANLVTRWSAAMAVTYSS